MHQFLLPMLLSHLITLSQRFYIAFVVRNWKKWIIFCFLQIKCLFELRFTHVDADLVELVLQLRPFFVFVLACKPNLVVSKALVVNCLLSKGFDQVFDGVGRFHLLLQLFLSLLYTIVGSVLHFYLVHVIIDSALGTDFWNRSLSLWLIIVVCLYRQQFDGETAGLWLGCLRQGNFTVDRLDSVEVSLIANVVFVFVVSWSWSHVGKRNVDWSARIVGRSGNFIILWRYLHSFIVWYWNLVWFYCCSLLGYTLWDFIRPKINVQLLFILFNLFDLLV